MEYHIPCRARRYPQPERHLLIANRPGENARFDQSKSAFLTFEAVPAICQLTLK